MAGIFGINLNTGCWEELRRGTKHLHPIRGDKFAGISVLVRNEVQFERGEDPVEILFKKALANNPHIQEGQMAIGAVDYQDPQPIFIKESRIGPFTIAGDVKIARRDELRETYPYLVGSDIEICAGLVAGGKDPADGLETVLKTVKGRYNLVVLTPDGLFACKDPWGFRSLAIARNEAGCCAVASESAALSAAFDETKSEIIREIKPGEIIQVESTGFRQLKQTHSRGLIICPFDIGYRQGPASIFEDISIGLARFNMGEKLAQRSGVDVEIVFPFPLSGNSAAEGYALQAKIPLMNVWQYNPFGRSYPPASEEERRKRAREKYSLIEWLVREFGKLVGVDDSIVEGRQLLARLFLLLMSMKKFHPSEKERELHLRIACPPKVNPCEIEVPFRPREILFAATHDLETMKRELGVKSLAFNILEDFVGSILSAQSEERKKENPIKPENLCLCCFTPGENLISKYFK